MTTHTKATISESILDGIRVIAIGGEVGAECALEIRDLLSTNSRADKSVVLDLSSVSFVDTSGLMTIVLASKRLRKNGGALRLVGLPPQVERVFRLSGVDANLSTYDDIKSAISACRARP